MKTHPECPPASCCPPTLLERPRFFPRMLITADELIQEHEYLRSKMRLHNRMLHGWGVVCGAQVCPLPEPPDEQNESCDTAGSGKKADSKGKVVIKPGFLLDPCGNEIVIDCEQVVDLRRAGACGSSGDSSSSDPWCSDVMVKREPGPLYIGVKYKEVPTRPVRVQPTGCGCDETACEYSRWRDGFEICVLRECPDNHQAPPELSTLAETFRGKLPSCPEKPEDLCVMLARVDLDGEGCVVGIDNCVCRRMVMSFAELWWACGERVQEESFSLEDRFGKREAFVQAAQSYWMEYARPEALPVGSKMIVVDPDAPEKEDPHFKVNESRIAHNRLRTLFAVSSAVPSGPRDIRIVGPDNGLLAHLERAFEVKTEVKDPTAPTPEPDQPTRKPRPGRKTKTTKKTTSATPTRKVKRKSTRKKASGRSR